MNPVWLGSTNYATVKGARSIRGIILHDSEGTLAGMRAIFNTPGSVSAHYAIGTDGRRYQFVQDADVAFHVAAFGNNAALNRNRPTWLPAYNGLYSAVNACTIGVELEGYASQGYTPAQYAELGLLVREKCQQYGIPLTLQPDAGTNAHVLTHGYLQTDRSDPGPLFDWQRFRDAVQGDPPMTEAQQLILDAAARHNLDAAGIDNLSGITTELSNQVASLNDLLTAAQAERDAQAAEAERLRTLAQQTATVTSAHAVSARLFAVVTMDDGSTQTAPIEGALV